MTDPFVRDDIIEAVLRSRAGAGAPAGLRAEILAAVEADGPRVVSRRRRVTGHPWRLLAVAAVLLTTFGTALFMGGYRPAVNTPSPAPTQPTADSSETFTSARAGYSVHVPAGWSVTRASGPWKTGGRTPWADPAFDVLQGGDERFAAASQPLVQDQLDTAWYRVFCQASRVADCSAAPGGWVPVTIGGSPGYVDIDGAVVDGGTSGSLRFDAVAVDGRRGYEFTMDGRVDRRTFEAVLASISLSPDQAADLPVLTGTFTSPTVGYSIGLADGWTTQAGTDASSGDQISVGGTDTTVYASSEALPNGQTFEAVLQKLYQGAFGEVPGGCEGGDPSTWKAVAVGSEQGRLQMLCNAATVHVLVGQRIYHFGWGNSTFVGTQHLSVASWEVLLQSVTFPSASTPASLSPAPPSTPIDRCAPLGDIARHAGAVTGGWTPGQKPNASSTIANGSIAVVPFAPDAGKPASSDHDVRLLDPATGRQAKVTDFGPFDTVTEFLAWSPSGANLAYLTSYGTDGDGCAALFVRSEDRLVQVLGSSTLWWEGLGWAPDDTAIAVVDQAPATVSSLLVVPADGSAPRSLGTICPTACYSFEGPIWSPDGSRIAIAGSGDQGQPVTSTIVNVGDGSRTPIGGSGIVRWLDGETLLVVARPGGPLATVHVPAPPQSAGTAVSPPAAVAWPPASMEASPDLDYALDWRTCGGLPSSICGVTVRDRASGKDRLVWSRKGVNLIAFWAPDSRSIVINVFKGTPAEVGIWTVGVNGSKAKRISDVPVAHNWPISWQPVWR